MPPPPTLIPSRSLCGRLLRRQQVALHRGQRVEVDLLHRSRRRRDGGRGGQGGHRRGGHRCLHRGLDRGGGGRGLDRGGGLDRSGDRPGNAGGGGGLDRGVADRGGGAGLGDFAGAGLSVVVFTRAFLEHLAGARLFARVDRLVAAAALRIGDGAGAGAGRGALGEAGAFLPPVAGARLGGADRHGAARARDGLDVVGAAGASVPVLARARLGAVDGAIAAAALGEVDGADGRDLAGGAVDVVVGAARAGLPIVAGARAPDGFAAAGAVLGVPVAAVCFLAGARRPRLAGALGVGPDGVGPTAALGLGHARARHTRALGPRLTGASDDGSALGHGAHGAAGALGLPEAGADFAAARALALGVGAARARGLLVRRRAERAEVDEGLGALGEEELGLGGDETEVGLCAGDVDGELVAVECLVGGGADGVGREGVLEDVSGVGAGEGRGVGEDVAAGCFLGLHGVDECVDDVVEADGVDVGGGELALEEVLDELGVAGGGGVLGVALSDDAGGADLDDGDVRAVAEPVGDLLGGVLRPRKLVILHDLGGDDVVLGKGLAVGGGHADAGDGLH
mmetsp:Transcript_9640/g.24179  ORF Transcript_9640/g.24179 Transcript_9640/m.24179 type:complete len:569 (+) Transcript_9640:251-1957(+)